MVKMAILLSLFTINILLILLPINIINSNNTMVVTGYHRGTVSPHSKGLRPLSHHPDEIPGKRITVRLVVTTIISSATSTSRRKVVNKNKSW